MQIHHHKKQIIITNTTTNTKKQLIKYTKTFSTTLLLILIILLSFIPKYIYITIINTYINKISTKKKYIIFSISSLLPILNSLFNPLIYIIKKKFFHIIFLQLLLQKTISKTKKIKKQIFYNSKKIKKNTFNQQPPIMK